MSQLNIAIANRASGEQVILVPEGSAMSTKKKKVSGEYLSVSDVSNVNGLSYVENTLNLSEVIATVNNKARYTLFGTVTVDAAIATQVASATAYVGLKNQKYFWFQTTELKDTVVVSYPQSQYIQKNAEILCTKNSKKEIKLDMFETDNAVVFYKPEAYVRFDVKEAFVNSVVKNSFSDVLSVPPVTAVVSDYKPPSIGSSLSGEGLKFIRLVAQKNAYAEIFLSFTQRKVIGVVGLPDGMILEKGAIKGSPQVSGVYPLILKLDNDTNLEALLTIPALTRLL